MRNIQYFRAVPYERCPMSGLGTPTLISTNPILGNQSRDTDDRMSINYNIYVRAHTAVCAPAPGCELRSCNAGESNQPQPQP